MTYATVSDVATRLGRPIDSASEVAQVQAWLSDVEVLILARIPDLHDRVTAGAPSADLVAMVEAVAVIRKMTNPDGKVSETIDDYTYRYNEQVRKGDLFIGADEWGLLLGDSAAAVASVRPSFEPDFPSTPPSGIFTVGDMDSGWYL